jgi:hypothetical protein
MTKAETALRHVVDEIDIYLSRLKGAKDGITSVRQGIAAHKKGTFNASQGRAPICGYLNEALDLAREQGNAALADAIADAGPYLPWVTYDSYPRELIGARFPKAHAFVSLIGKGAPFEAEDYDLGLFLIEPRTLYRDHRHLAPELYAPITGPHPWRFGIDDPWRSLPANIPVWNEPQRVHATLVGEKPFLAVFAWTRDVSAPASVVPAPDWLEIEAGL